jgi:hypothetical protein
MSGFRHRVGGQRAARGDEAGEDRSRLWAAIDNAGGDHGADLPFQVWSKVDRR